MAMELVSTVTIGSGGSVSIEWTNIPQTGKDLLVLFSARTSNSVTSEFLWFQFNGLTTNYNGQFLRGSGTSVNSQSRLNNDAWETFFQGNSTTANTFGNGSLYITNYTSNTDKTGLLDHVWERNGSTADSMITSLSKVAYSGITSLKMAGTSSSIILAQHTTASLYIIS
jgi:hypothetical protein